MFADDRPTRIAATTELVRKWTSDPRVVELAISAASANLSHGSGRINTLVLLESVDAQVLGEYVSDVDSLLRKFEAAGGLQTAQHVQVVRGRLGGVP